MSQSFDLAHSLGLALAIEVESRGRDLLAVSPSSEELSVSNGVNADDLVLVLHEDRVPLLSSPEAVARVAGSFALASSIGR